MESVLTSPTSIAHIVLVYALVISVGLALGRIKVFGVSLGVTFVLFVGLAAGHFGMAIEPHVLTFLRDFGLILFIFFIGLQVGPSFFSSFKSGGIILNGLAAGAVVLSILVTILLWALTAGLIDLPTMLGVHFGAVTNTPGLGATQEALAVMGWQGADIAVAYACAYPLGVVGIIVSAIIIRIIFRVNLAEEDKAGIVAFFGKEALGVDLQIQHSPIHSETVLVTDPKVNGLKISDLHLSHYDGLNITRLFRAGMELFPYRSIHLQLGDRLRVVGPERAIMRFTAHVGNQSHKLDHPNIISIFVGIALGILAGILPIAIPGIPVPVKLGLAGGPLIVAILLGRYGPNLRLATYTTNSASLMLRELGIAFFLASVGLAAGDGFLQAFVSGEGFAYMALGLCITMLPLLVVGYVARKFFSLNYLSIVGMMAGTTTDPPALAYAATLSEKNSSAVAYSTVYPLAMFLRILTGQALLLIFWAEL